MAGLRPQNQPRPAWLDFPEGWHGACPYRVGSNLIIKYVGQHRKDRRTKQDKLQHVHLTKCLKCGAVTERLQASILQAVRKKSKGCAKCKGKEKRCSESEYKRRKREKEAKALNKWLGIMHAMPVTKGY